MTGRDDAAMPPLTGTKVLDFSTLLPGPLASLVLAEAGAEVIKVERPGGEEMRRYAGPFGEASASFALLNRGKASLCLDLKSPDDRRRLEPYFARADILIEQFRPGVMGRFGLGFERLRAVNPGLIYCSITGYGQHGPQRDKAGHDLNFMAETGALALGCGVDGAPTIPPVLAADIAGGAYPALVNILLALLQRNATGQGCRLDIAMADNLFTLSFWGLAAGFATGAWPRPGNELLTGGSPRYQVYRTADDRFIAAAPLEDHFWRRFCDAIGLSAEEQDDRSDPRAVIDKDAARIRGATAEEWRARFADIDACVSVVASLRDAVSHPQFVARGLFTRRVADSAGRAIPALPVPVVPAFRTGDETLGYPRIGDAGKRALWSGEGGS
ncbi:MAG: CaiB/BaiF CoA transferase family protein [Rhodoplanes sp.]